MRNVKNTLKDFLIFTVEDYHGEAVEDEVKEDFELLNMSLEQIKDELIKQIVDPEKKVRILKVFEYINEESIEEDLNKTPEDFLKNAVCKVISFSDKLFEKKFRRFAINEQKGAFIPLDFLVNKSLYISNTNYINTIRRAILDSIVYFTKEDKANDFLDYFYEESKIIGVLVNRIQVEDIELYSFLYINYLSKGYFSPINPELVYEYNVIHETEITLSEVDLTREEKFVQFFEIFDVVNEYHSHNDMLNKFIKMYQIIEYLAYRYELVSLQISLETKKSFIMQLQKINEKFIRNEKDTFVKNYGKIFEDEKNMINTKLKELNQAKPDIFIKLKEHLDISFDFNIVNNITNNTALAIYLLRCALVHNKESELHITMFNIGSEYKEFIEFIKIILNLFENIVLKKLCKYHTKITYTKSYLSLY
jgi:hypothetical protein